MKGDENDPALDQVARILYEGLPEKATRKYRDQRGPWRNAVFMDAARAALPVLLNDLDLAAALTPR